MFFNSKKKKEEKADRLFQKVSGGQQNINKAVLGDISKIAKKGNPNQGLKQVDQSAKKFNPVNSLLSDIRTDGHDKKRALRPTQPKITKADLLSDIRTGSNKVKQELKSTQGRTISMADMMTDIRTMGKEQKRTLKNVAAPINRADFLTEVRSCARQLGEQLQAADKSSGKKSGGPANFSELLADIRTSGAKIKVDLKNVQTKPDIQTLMIAIRGSALELNSKQDGKSVEAAIKPSFGDLMSAVRTEGKDKKRNMANIGQPKATKIELLSAIRTDGQQKKQTLKKAPATRADLFASINHLKIKTTDDNAGNVSVLQKAGLKKAKTVNQRGLMTSIRMEGMQLKQGLRHVDEGSKMPTMSELRAVRQQQQEKEKEQNHSPRSPQELAAVGSPTRSGSPDSPTKAADPNGGAWYPENMTKTRAAAIGATYCGQGKLDKPRSKESEDPLDEEAVGEKVVRRSSSVFMDKIDGSDVAAAEAGMHGTGELTLLISGYLEKQTTGNGWVSRKGTWQKRFFALTDKYLRYYSDQRACEKDKSAGTGMAGAKAFMELKLIEQCSIGFEETPVATNLAQLRANKKKQQADSKSQAPKNLILLRMKASKNSKEINEVAFRAQTEADALEWAKAINNCIGGQLKPKAGGFSSLRKVSLSQRYDKNLVQTNPFAKKNYYTEAAVAS